ncbi:MAG: glycosyltransferase [Candidatus Nanohalobium sp.]
MKIGFFADSYFPRRDGQVYTVKSWKQKLEDRGHEVHIIYPESSYEPDKGEIPLRSVKNPLYKHYIGLPTSYSKIPELDVVHCHSPGPVGLLGKRYADKKDIPKVYTFHTPLEDYIPHVVKLKSVTKLVQKLYVGLENRLLSSFDLVTSNTEEFPRKVDFEELPAGIDMEFFQEAENSFIDEMDIERPVAGYCGRLSEEKKLGDIIEFFNDIDATLIIAGEGRDEERLRKKASDNVIFKDFIDRERLPEFYTGIDVFVTGSESDTLSLTTLEASACGTPALAPDVHPFTETIQENGERFTPGDAEDFRSKFEKVTSQEYSTREHVRPYSMQKTIDKLVGFYKEMT